MRKLDPEYLIPLSPIEFQILVALAGRPLYGAAIIDECQHDSEQVLGIRPSTMYPALRRLEKMGLIEETQTSPRRVYGLSPAGREILRQETSRLSQAVHLAEHRL